MEKLMSEKKSILVIAGLDADQRPHAAQFAARDEPSVTKAAALMGMQVGLTRDARALSAARSLPKGKLFATGRALVPYVKEDIFGQIQSLIVFVEPVSSAPASPSVAEREAITSVATGDIVLAFESKALGWWEAVILSLDEKSKLATLRWRDFPEAKKFNRPLKELAVIGVAKAAGGKTT